uniref:Si:dkey-148a17.5 n=1 Tax=Sinocyclocheilus rhinocerous TaxID=307959 RepID=A0A673M390_9TELE
HNISNISYFQADEETELGLVGACVILGVCFLVGTPGNLLVVWTILKHVKQRSHTVLLILHLAAADLLVLITLPLWIYSPARSWVFGEAACKAMVYIINACMYSSMLYWQNGISMFRILAVTWILSFILGIPVILTQYLDDDGAKHCLYREYNSMSFEVFCMCLETLLGFIIPFLTLAICYCQVAVQLRKVRFRTKKTAFLICGVVVAFIVCWLPHHILISQIALAFISSSVNPVLYAFASENVHGNLKKSGIVKLFQDLATQTQQMTEGFLQDSGLQHGKILEDSNGGEQRDLTDF